MKTQSIFNFLLASTIAGALTLVSCESGDNRRDSNSETTEGDVNDPTKYNSGSNTSTRTGGSMGLNDPGKQGTTDLMSEHQTNQSATTNEQTSGKSGLNSSSSNTDLGGTSSGTQNITKDPNVKNTGTTGRTGRASGMQK